MLHGLTYIEVLTTQIILVWVSVRAEPQWDVWEGITDEPGKTMNPTICMEGA